MCFQVQRALEFHVTGEFVRTSGAAGEFSKINLLTQMRTKPTGEKVAENVNRWACSINAIKLEVWEEIGYRIQQLWKDGVGQLKRKKADELSVATAVALANADNDFLYVESSDEEEVEGEGDKEEVAGAMEGDVVNDSGDDVEDNWYVLCFSTG